MVLTEKFFRPTRRQAERLIKIATLREITDLPATRVERVRAMTRVLEQITRAEADVLIKALSSAPSAKRWRERTPEFVEQHEIAVERLGGPARVVSDVKWIPDPPRVVVPSKSAKAWAKDILEGHRRKRVTKKELEAWASSLETVHDETWGDVLVGSWG